MRNRYTKECGVRAFFRRVHQGVRFSPGKDPVLFCRIHPESPASAAAPCSMIWRS